MKTLLITSLLIVAPYLGQMFQPKKEHSVVKAKFEQVKVYEQPSTGSEIVTTLSKDQEVDYFRKSIANGGNWSIIRIGEKPGYVLTSELYKEILPTVSEKLNTSKNLFSHHKKVNTQD
ncbi:SH3 domain-containing protein [Arthrospiribacter ruber]|nr:SH3 domain-containing protein [Arthrospiribacter ruber]